MSHRHVCRCGNWLVCHQERDHCPIKYFDCPVCEDKALDDYFAARFDASTSSTHTHELELTHGKSH